MLRFLSWQAVKTQEAKQTAEEEHEAEGAQELYCLCQQPDDPAAPRDFVACDKCEQWFHPECVDTTLEVKLLLMSSAIFSPAHASSNACICGSQTLHVSLQVHS